MRNPKWSWLSKGAAVLAVAAFVAGCGGSSPQVVTEPELPMEEPTEPTTPPAPRDTTSAYVDPNTQYAEDFRAIHFEFNRYRITEEAKPRLERIATLMKDNAAWKVLIEGHCDERGTNEYNLSLGENRAQSTKQYLVQLGVSETSFQTISYGEERPVDMGQTEAAWAKNRRAEFRIEAPRS